MDGTSGRSGSPGRPGRQGVSLNIRSMLAAALLLFIVNDAILIGFLSLSLKTYAMVNQVRNIIGRIQALETNELHYRISGNRSYAVTNAETIERAMRDLAGVGMFRPPASWIPTTSRSCRKPSGRILETLCRIHGIPGPGGSPAQWLQKNRNRSGSKLLTPGPEAGQNTLLLQARLAIQEARLLEAQVHEGTNSAARDSALLWQSNMRRPGKPPVCSPDWKPLPMAWKPGPQPTVYAWKPSTTPPICSNWKPPSVPGNGWMTDCILPCCPWNGLDQNLPVKWKVS
jgi:hypothetical protein